MRAVFFLLLAVEATAQEPSAKPLRVGAGFSMPLAYLTPEGEPAGFFVEVFREAARRENLALQFNLEERSPDRFLNNGKGDLWAGAVPTREREAQFHFTKPWWILDTFLAVRQASEITDVSRVAGKVLLYNRFPPYSIPPSQFLPGAHLQVEELLEKRFAALCAGRVEGAVFYETNVRHVLTRPEFQACREEGLKIIPFHPPVRQLSIMATHASKDVAERLWTRIDEMKRDGTMERLPTFHQTGNDLWKAQVLEERSRGERRLWQLGLLFATLLFLGSLFAYFRLRKAHALTQQALVTASTADRVKSEFLATMSHEIRTPLTAVRGYMDLLIGTPLRPDQRRVVREAAQATESLFSMFATILDYRRQTEAPLPLRQEAFDPTSVIDDCVSAVQMEAEAKDLALVAAIDASVPAQVIGDADRLRHMLLNVITNAVKFTEEGWVSVKASYGDIQGQPTLRVAVADSGPGIPAEKQQFIFLPFTQVDATHTRSRGGIGLGLAIVSQFCRQMGGSVMLESREGEGAEFVMTVPLGRAGADSWLPRASRSPQAAVAFWNEGPQTNILRGYLTSAGIDLEIANSPRDVPAAVNRARSRGDWPLLLVDGERLGETEKEMLPSQTRLVLVGSMRSTQDAIERLSRTPDALLPFPVLARDLRALLAPAETPVAAPALQGAPVLVADDNAVNRRVLQAMLQRLGCSVDVACDGAEALAKAKAKSYALILMDCQMPVMSGFDATRRIREQVGAVLIWGVSAASESEVRQQCLDCGMNDYLAKPVPLPYLQRRLSALFTTPVPLVRKP